MKIYFIFEFTNKPKGGVFQFTKALMNYLDGLGCVTNDPKEADIFFMSAFQYADKIIKLKKEYPNKIFIHRIDGPIRLYNRINDRRDLVVNKLNEMIADGTIFQSNWSKEKNINMGLVSTKYESTILNAPNPNIFNTIDKKQFVITNKIRLIATSWSSNWKKGFDVYKWMDENLDFTKYDMTFIGNSPIVFKNIIQKEPMDSESIADELKQHDIFITASKSDPCSNSLIEAMHCGLPSLGLNDGGHPEIIRLGGKVFNNQNDIPHMLDDLVDNYEYYKSNISPPSIDDVGQLYFQFFTAVFDDYCKNLNIAKSINLSKTLLLKLSILLWKLEEKTYILKKVFK
jgi:glycosyltransferase involved in cell wall biosynthesis